VLRVFRRASKFDPLLISSYLLSGGKTLYARQQKRHRCEKQTFELCGRRQGWDDLRE